MSAAKKTGRAGPRGQDRSPLDAERLKQLFDYDPVAGKLNWKPGLGMHGVPRDGRRVSKLTRDGYLAVIVDGKQLHAARIAWLLYTGEDPDGYVELDNGIQTDLRWANFRLIDSVLRSAKRPPPKTNTSGFKGVSQHFRGSWCAYIHTQRGKLHIGLYDKPEAAALAYNAAALRIFGPRAFLNEVAA